MAGGTPGMDRGLWQGPPAHGDTPTGEERPWGHGLPWRDEGGHTSPSLDLMQWMGVCMMRSPSCA